MKILAFQARHFAWKAFSRTLEQDAADEARSTQSRVEDAVVAFLHLEEKDGEPEEKKRVLRHTLKHLKWMANKREWKRIVLHSFTHLGGRNAAPEHARTFLEELGERLRDTGYEVHATPFGWFCQWDLAVHGESLAKVWKEV